KPGDGSGICSRAVANFIHYTQVYGITLKARSRIRKDFFEGLLRSMFGGRLLVNGRRKLCHRFGGTAVVNDSTIPVITRDRTVPGDKVTMNEEPTVSRSISFVGLLANTHNAHHL